MGSNLWGIIQAEQGGYQVVPIDGDIKGLLFDYFHTQEEAFDYCYRECLPIQAQLLPEIPQLVEELPF